MTADGAGHVREDEYIAAVLAGGRGRRMGADKASLEIGGRSVLERVLDCLMDIFTKILLVVQDENYNTPAGYGERLKVVVDVLPGKGPLGGIYTALEHSPAPYVFVIACDMPYPSCDLIHCLLAEAPGRDAVVPRRGEYIEPLFAVYSRETRGKILPRLESNRLKIHEFIDNLNVRYLDENEISACDPRSRSFFNINTPEDLENV
jgi:molybdenum cofactor guanylyltransferase